jgi:hypothetical protein
VLELTIMKLFYLAATLVVLTAGCASTSSPATSQTNQPGSAETDSYILHSPDGATSGDSASRPPRLTVGVSDPNTQLILPWFLNDIINLVNYR